jgi:hypothetical protein
MGNHLVFSIFPIFSVLFSGVFDSKIFFKQSFIDPLHYLKGDRGSTVVKVLRYKSEGRCFDPRWCRGIFQRHKPF